MFKFFAETLAYRQGPLEVHRSLPCRSLYRVTPLAISVIAALCSQTICATSLEAESSARPNVVVILSDDQGWGDLSLNGNPNLSTPNIDSLARDGAEFENFYVCSVCSPTRAEFLTGRYHSRSGVYSTSSGGERFAADERTIADVFKSAGYETAAYGKWHSGMQYPYHPNARGFDDYYGFCSGHWGDYFSPMLEHNGRLVTGSGFLVDDLTDHAIDFIDQHRSDPFFVYLPYNTPHSPMQVPDAYWDKFKDKPLVADPVQANADRQDDNHTRAALAMCENIDDNVGRLLSHLDSTGLAEDTIVVYFSDNGPNGYRFNGGMRGRKGSTNEGGLRSPLLIRYPRKIQPGTKVDLITSATDLLPTLAQLASLQDEPAKPLDGISMASALQGRPIKQMGRTIFSTWNGRASLRSDRFRYHESGQLFDIAGDRGESQDVSKVNPKVAASMDRELRRYLAELKPQKSQQKETRPITLGHPDAKYNQMPARDAEPRGGIQRSNKFPNCTFMKNWVDTDGEIVWDVDVLGKGRHEVSMLYACTEGNEGSVIELSLGDQRIQATIADPHDVPLRGMENDRDRRSESYIKDWNEITLGTMQLTPGRGELKLRAIRVAGTEVAEMRLLMFRRLE